MDDKEDVFIDYSNYNPGFKDNCKFSSAILNCPEKNLDTYSTHLDKIKAQTKVLSSNFPSSKYINPLKSKINLDQKTFGTIDTTPANNLMPEMMPQNKFSIDEKTKMFNNNPGSSLPETKIISNYLKTHIYETPITYSKDYCSTQIITCFKSSCNNIYTPSSLENNFSKTNFVTNKISRLSFKDKLLNSTNNFSDTTLRKASFNKCINNRVKQHDDLFKYNLHTPCISSPVTFSDVSTSSSNLSEIVAPITCSINNKKVCKTTFGMSNFGGDNGSQNSKSIFPFRFNSKRNKSALKFSDLSLFKHGTGRTKHFINQFLATNNSPTNNIYCPCETGENSSNRYYPTTTTNSHSQSRHRSNSADDVNLEMFHDYQTQPSTPDVPAVTADSFENQMNTYQDLNGLRDKLEMKSLGQHFKRVSYFEHLDAQSITADYVMYIKFLLQLHKKLIVSLEQRRRQIDKTQLCNSNISDEKSGHDAPRANASLAKNCNPVDFLQVHEIHEGRKAGEKLQQQPPSFCKTVLTGASAALAASSILAAREESIANLLQNETSNHHQTNEYQNIVGSVGSCSNISKRSNAKASAKKDEFTYNSKRFLLEKCFSSSATALIIDPGDGRSNELVESCAFFRNEIGKLCRDVVASGTNYQPTNSVKLSDHLTCSDLGYSDTWTTNTISRGLSILDYSHHRPSLCDMLYVNPAISPNLLPISNLPDMTRNLRKQYYVIENWDNGAYYYRLNFLGKEHWNYFGNDINFGPIAISLARRVRNVNTYANPTDIYDSKSIYYDIIIRTNQLCSIKGCVAEEVVPAAPYASTSTSFDEAPIVAKTLPINKSSQVRPFLTTTDSISDLWDSGSSRLPQKNKNCPVTHRDVLAYACPFIDLECLKFWNILLLHTQANRSGPSIDANTTECSGISGILTNNTNTTLTQNSISKDTFVILPQNLNNRIKIEEKLTKYDEQLVKRNYKFGVLYCKPGQVTEEEMYNNEETSDYFESFITSLADKIVLKGFDKFKGDLDTKSGSSGTYSFYTTINCDYESGNPNEPIYIPNIFEGNTEENLPPPDPVSGSNFSPSRFTGPRNKPSNLIQIMFHVSSLLPFTASNKQQLFRKRHIGNDVVTIVFQDPSTSDEKSLPFSAKRIRSHFQHVFIIVRPIISSTILPSSASPINTPLIKYKVAISRSKDVESFGPPLPPDGMFKDLNDLRNYLLIKCINADNSAQKSPKFAGIATRGRLEWLKEIVNENSSSVSLSEILPVLSPPSSNSDKYSIFIPGYRFKSDVLSSASSNAFSLLNKLSQFGSSFINSVKKRDSTSTSTLLTIQPPLPTIPLIQNHFPSNTPNNSVKLLSHSYLINNHLRPYSPLPNLPLFPAQSMHQPNNGECHGPCNLKTIKTQASSRPYHLPTGAQYWPLSTISHLVPNQNDNHVRVLTQKSASSTSTRCASEYSIVQLFAISFDVVCVIQTHQPTLLTQMLLALEQMKSKKFMITSGTSTATEELNMTINNLNHHATDREWIDLFATLDIEYPRIAFAIPTCSIIGWKVMRKKKFILFFDEGNYQEFQYDDSLIDITNLVERLKEVTRGKQVQQFEIRKESNDSPVGLFINNEGGYIVDIEIGGLAWKAGLRRGYRIVQLSDDYVVNIPIDKISELFKHGMYFKIIAIPPLIEGKPIRACQDPSCILASMHSTDIRSNHQKTDSRLTHHDPNNTDIERAPGAISSIWYDKHLKKTTPARGIEPTTDETLTLPFKIMDLKDYTGLNSNNNNNNNYNNINNKILKNELMAVHTSSSQSIKPLNASAKSHFESASTSQINTNKTHATQLYHSGNYAAATLADNLHSYKNVYNMCSPAIQSSVQNIKSIGKSDFKNNSNTRTHLEGVENVKTNHFQVTTPISDTTSATYPPPKGSYNPIFSSNFNFHGSPRPNQKKCGKGIIYAEKEEEAKGKVEDDKGKEGKIVSRSSSSFKTYGAGMTKSCFEPIKYNKDDTGLIGGSSLEAHEQRLISTRKVGILDPNNQIAITTSRTILSNNYKPHPSHKLSPFQHLTKFKRRSPPYHSLSNLESHLRRLINFDEEFNLNHFPKTVVPVPAVKPPDTSETTISKSVDESVRTNHQKNISRTKPESIEPCRDEPDWNYLHETTTKAIQMCDNGSPLSCDNGAKASETRSINSSFSDFIGSTNSTPDDMSKVIYNLQDKCRNLESLCEKESQSKNNYKVQLRAVLRENKKLKKQLEISVPHDYPK